MKKVSMKSKFNDAGLDLKEFPAIISLEFCVIYKK